MKDIYTTALRVLPASDIDHDNNGTDLYLKVSEASAALVASYDFRGNVEKFRSPLDGCLWFDVPFAYTPAWAEKLQRQRKVDVGTDKENGKHGSSCPVQICKRYDDQERYPLRQAYCY